MLNLTSEVTTRHPIYPTFNAAPEVTRRPLSQDIHVFHVMYNVYLRITFDQVKSCQRLPLIQEGLFSLRVKLVSHKARQKEKKKT